MKYDKICVLFKNINSNLYQWVISRSKEEDMSMSSFIIRSLKKIKKAEETDDDKKNPQQ